MLILVIASIAAALLIGVYLLIALFLQPKRTPLRHLLEHVVKKRGKASDPS